MGGEKQIKFMFEIFEKLFLLEGAWCECPKIQFLKRQRIQKCRVLYSSFKNSFVKRSHLLILENTNFVMKGKAKILSTLLTLQVQCHEIFNLTQIKLQSQRQHLAKNLQNYKQ